MVYSRHMHKGRFTFLVAGEKLIAGLKQKFLRSEAYRKVLLSINGSWNLDPEIKANREAQEKQIAKRVM